jgi:solute carrier family 66 (lysosomal lysine-arginine transporter), member 1
MKSDDQGDITNLLGCILTHQLPFQTLLACYYVLVDSVLMFQFFFYKILFPPRPQILIPQNNSAIHQHRPLSPPTSSAPVIIHRITPNRDFQRSVVSIAIMLGFISFVAAEPDPVPELPDGDMAEWLGHVFAWICCGFYLSSRLPQIIENHRRKSTRGVNIGLFTAALCGNLCYTIGILTNPHAHNVMERREFLVNALPYLLGSAGYFPFGVSLIVGLSCLMLRL